MKKKSEGHWNTVASQQTSGRGMMNDVPPHQGKKKIKNIPKILFDDISSSRSASLSKEKLHWTTCLAYYMEIIGLYYMDDDEQSS